MPTFATPEPIFVTVDLGVGDLQIAASDRADTVVAIRPSDPARKSDVSAAEQTRVEYAAGRLVIKTPKRQFSFSKGRESVDVEIALPSGSHVEVDAGVAALRSTGRLSECRCRTGVGDIQFDQVGPAQLRTGMGDITVHRVSGHAEITTGSGALRIGTLAGTAVVRNSNGDTSIAEARDDLRVNAGNGTITVDHAFATVAAKTANGSVRLGEVVRGAILAQTALGTLEIGIREGVAAWLDLNTHFGTVHSDLGAAERPERGEDVVEVRARSSCGDIIVRRSAAIVSGVAVS